MKTYFLVALAGAILLCGCSKKQQALEDMQQPMSPEDLTKFQVQVTETAAVPVQEAAIVPSIGENKLEPLPPSGPFKPSAREIQAALKNAGFYSGEVDGKIGPMSMRAIEEFQKANGLEADGKVGPKTWAVLGKFFNPVSSTEASEALRQ